MARRVVRRTGAFVGGFPGPGRTFRCVRSHGTKSAKLSAGPSSAKCCARFRKRMGTIDPGVSCAISKQGCAIRGKRGTMTFRLHGGDTRKRLMCFFGVFDCSVPTKIRLKGTGLCTMRTSKGHVRVPIGGWRECAAEGKIPRRPMPLPFLWRSLFSCLFGFRIGPSLISFASGPGTTELSQVLSLMTRSLLTLTYVHYSGDVSAAFPWTSSHTTLFSTSTFEPEVSGAGE